MRCRFAVDEVRSAEGEFSQQSGGLLGKEGETCKRGLSLKALPIRNRFPEGCSLLQSTPLLQNNPPDCSAIHSPQSALRLLQNRKRVILCVDLERFFSCEKE